MAVRRRARRASVSPAGRVRIIGGAWKRTPITVVEAAGLRPTPDRVRETVFNWLNAAIAGSRCLDVFAGTGALGLEAASRGAQRVVLIEQDRAACLAIRALIEKLKAQDRVSLLEGDALAKLTELATDQMNRFDLVFLDPPFGERWLERVWSRLLPLLRDDARVYVEAEQAFRPPEGWCIDRSGRAGQVHYHLLVRGGVAAADA